MENYEKIYNAAFDLIEIRLNKKEEVYPFLIYLSDTKPELIISMAESGLSDLKEEMKIKSNQVDILASCVCYGVEILDPRTNEMTDAVLIEFVDKNNAKKVYIPYNFKDEEIIKKPFQISPEATYS